MCWKEVKEGQVVCVFCSTAKAGVFCRTAKVGNFSNHVRNIIDRPKVLFNALDSLVNPYITDLIEPSPALCGTFLDVSVLRSTLPPVASEPSSPALCQAVFDQSGLGQKQRYTNYLPDSIPSQVSCLFWLCVFSSSLPACHTQPLMKKPSLDSSILSNFRPNSKLPFLSKVLLLSFLQSGDLEKVPVQFCTS